MATKKTFGKFVQDITPGNKSYHVYHTGKEGDKEVKHYAKVNAYNRDEADEHAKKVFKKRNPNVGDIRADHIGDKELNEEERKKYNVTTSEYSGLGRMADTKIVPRTIRAKTEDEAKKRAQRLLDLKKKYGKVLDADEM